MSDSTDEPVVATEHPAPSERRVATDSFGAARAEAIEEVSKFPGINDNSGHEEPAPGPVESEPAQPVPGARVRIGGYVVSGVLLFCSVAGPLLFYFLGWRYRPLASHHLPERTAVVARLEGRELYLFEPFQKHVLPLLENAPGTASRAEILKKHTGIDFRADVREIVVATTTDDEAIALLGGRLEGRKFRRVPFVESLERFFVEVGAQGFSLDGPLLVGHGLAVAQADDRTILIGSSPELVRSCLATTTVSRDLGLTTSGAASFAVSPAEIARRAAREGDPFASAFERASRVTGYVKLKRGQAFFYVDALPIEGQGPEALAAEVAAAVRAAEPIAASLPERFTAPLALSTVRTKSRATSVMLEGIWPREGVDHAFAELGRRLGERL
jgi:hypothetical protein